ncbi:MAG: hybrid sensor histidine kinase/response regulator, partial [Spirochaetota bacterium]
LMGELLKNLLSNAIKFSPKNSKIELLFTASSKYHCISVIDYGIGMTEDRLEKVFHLTSKQVSFGTEGETGTGFGLSLCRDIIKAHGGNIEIKSQVDLGTQVNVYLPSNERIVFLVDSNDAFRLRLKKELTSYESLLCIDFANPKSCLEMLQNTKPNTIITEFYFPEMNGIELCETIQQNGEFADISMILCTDLKKTRPNDKGLFSHIFSKSDKEVMKKIDSVIQNL